MLNINRLYAGYGKFKVLFDLEMEVPANEITVVVGPNGAGKTTLLNSIMGVATVFSGDVVYQGKRITGTPPHKAARMGISYVPQMGNVFAGLSVSENLQMAGYWMGKNELNNRVDQVLDMFPVLRQFIGRKAGTLSGGERRMLAIAMGLMRTPKLMLLDELSTDLAPIIAKRVMNEVARLRNELGITVLLVEQMAKRALEIGDTAYLLVSGQVRFRGKAGDLLRDPELSRVYLGIKES
ncbi:MAG: ABC transporter ATP-binding protein [Firmicutes bacterium]|nr:ABC transporter ATP-binding protein [Bacillota bacterium]